MEFLSLRLFFGGFTSADLGGPNAHTASAPVVDVLTTRNLLPFNYLVVISAAEISRLYGFPFGPIPVYTNSANNPNRGGSDDIVLCILRNGVGKRTA